MHYRRLLYVLLYVFMHRQRWKLHLVQSNLIITTLRDGNWTAQTPELCCQCLFLQTKVTMKLCHFMLQLHISLDWIFCVYIVTTLCSLPVKVKAKKQNTWGYFSDIFHMKSRQKYLFFVPITGLQNVLISKQTTQLEKTFQLFKNVQICCH